MESLKHTGTALDSCLGLSRRDALRAAGALGVSFLLPALETRAAHERGKVRQKSLITIFLEGGASQLETWDPKPEAPAEVRGPFHSIATSVPGIRFALRESRSSRWELAWFAISSRRW